MRFRFHICNWLRFLSGRPKSSWKQFNIYMAGRVSMRREKTNYEFLPRKKSQKEKSNNWNFSFFSVPFWIVKIFCLLLLLRFLGQNKLEVKSVNRCFISRTEIIAQRDTEVALKLEISLSSPSLTAQKPNLSFLHERKQTQTLAAAT